MRPARRGLVLSLMLGFCLVCSAQVSSQEWGKVFNPYTGQWEDLNPPAPDPPNRQSETAPVEVLKRSPAPCESTSGSTAAGTGLHD